MDPSELYADLRRAGEAISPLTRSEDQFRAVFDAFRAEDGESFQRLLRELELLDRCELICSWLRSKECVLVCLELAGPPPQEVPELREFAEVLVRINSDEESVERLAASVSERDAEAFGTLVRDMRAERFAHLLCHWVCWIRGRLICRVVCGPPTAPRPHLTQELASEGQAVRQLLDKPEVLQKAAEAAQQGRCEVLRGVLQDAGLSEHCEIICRWICTWRCIWICLRFCRPFLTEKPDTSLGEALEFARVTARLAGEPAVLERLTSAVTAQNADAFEAIVKELRLERFCIQLCHWVCFHWCRLFCICVCPPVSDAYFIRIGAYDYHTAVNSAVGGNGLTIGDNRAFYDTLRLNGNISDLLSGPQIEYRFETRPTDAAGTPSGAWAPVAPGQIAPTLIGWFDPGFFPFTAYVINGTPGPHEVVATVSADGWVQVPPLFSLRGQFLPSGDLAEFISNSVAPGLPHQNEAGVTAGTSANHPLASDVYFGIRMRVRQIGNPATEHDGGTCPHIAIDNTLYDSITRHPDWDGGLLPPGQLAVSMVDVQELQGNGCADLHDSLTVLFTATHPNLDPAGVSISLTGPGGPYGFTLPAIPETGNWYGAATPSGWSLSDLPDCAYIVTLSVNVLLTNGDASPLPLQDQIAFCKTS